MSKSNPLAPTRTELLRLIRRDTYKKLQIENQIIREKLHEFEKELEELEKQASELRVQYLEEENKTLLDKLEKALGFRPVVVYHDTIALTGQVVGTINTAQFRLYSKKQHRDLRDIQVKLDGLKVTAETMNQQMRANNIAMDIARDSESFADDLLMSNMTEDSLELFNRLVNIASGAVKEHGTICVSQELARVGGKCLIANKALPAPAVPSDPEVEVID